jgi:hypothetical protein
MHLRRVRQASDAFPPRRLGSSLARPAANRASEGTHADDALPPRHIAREAGFSDQAAFNRNWPKGKQAPRAAKPWVQAGHEPRARFANPLGLRREVFERIRKDGVHPSGYPIGVKACPRHCRKR